MARDVLLLADQKLQIDFGIAGIIYRRYTCLCTDGVGATYMAAMGKKCMQCNLTISETPSNLDVYQQKTHPNNVVSELDNPMGTVFALV